MNKKFYIEYREWGSDGLAYFYDSYYYNQYIFRRLTIRDVKEFVKEKRYKIHKPVCTCCLEIRKYTYTHKYKYYINFSSCFEYNDSTYLDNTVFSLLNPIVVIPIKNKRCTCGQLDRLIICSNFEKQREEDQKRWDEKQRKDREYYDRRLREEQNNHRNEINRLQNLISQQRNDNLQQMNNQQKQYRTELERMKTENNRRENEFNQERRINNERFQNLQNERNQERRANDEKLRNMENERNQERRMNNERFQNLQNERKQERRANDEKLRNMENERNRERQENIKKFENIEKERNRERESYTQRFNTLESNLREKEEQLQKNTQKLEENEKQKKFREKCEKDAENEFISQNNKIYQTYYEKNKTLVAEEIKNKISQLIYENIKFENINDDFIYEIVKKEKFIKNVREFIEDKFSNLNDDNLNIKISSFNIIIVGNTGVGKSTLLNTVLKEQLAKTQIGDACTMGVPKPYESEKAKGIRIWDSRGIENGKYNLEAAFSDIKNTIDCLIKENDPDKFIHCIWYCVKSNRFIEDEIENLNNYYNSYIEKLPIIIIFTRSENQFETDQMMEIIKTKLENIKKLNGFQEKSENDIKILKVLAQDYKTDLGVIKSFGIHNLMEQTSQSAKIGLERAFIHSLMEKGKNMLREEFDEIINKLRIKIYENKNENNNNNENDQINNILGNILNEEKNKKNNLNINIIKNFDFINFKNFCKIFSREIVKLLLFKDSISEETISSIDNNLERVSKEADKYLQKEFESLFENISNKLAENLVDFVHNLEAKYQVSNLSSKYNYNELKRQAKNGINKDFKIVIEDIIYREISKIIYNKFSDIFSNELMNCFHFLLKNNKNIKEIFNKRAQENTVACMDKIKNLMDYPSDSYEERNPKKKKSKYEELEEDED